MIPTRFYHYRDPAAMLISLGDLRRQGLTPRGLLFLALDTSGEIYLAIPDDIDEVTRLRVGEKLTLKPPWEGRYCHFDAIHRLPVGGVLWTGDRRLHRFGGAVEVAHVLSEWLKGYGSRDVILGCTPHSPGAWWAQNEQSAEHALHESGYVDVVTTRLGLVARRIGEPHLYYLPYATFLGSAPVDGWQPVFESSLGNILMLERRVLGDTLIATCAGGLVEVGLKHLPKVHESVRVELRSGFGVVGRIDGGAFAVTCGEPQPWGLDQVAPALLVGTQGDTLRDLALSLEAQRAVA